MPGLRRVSSTLKHAMPMQGVQRDALLALFVRLSKNSHRLEFTPNAG